MSSKLLKRCTSIILAVILIISCVPSVFAVLSDREEKIYNTPGGIFVNLKSDAPSFEELLPGFEIAEITLIKSVSDDDTGYLVCEDVLFISYRLDFVNETDEILEAAADILSESPYVLNASVNNAGKAPAVTTPAATENDSTDSTSSTDTTEDIIPDYIPVTTFKNDGNDYTENIVLGDANGDGVLSIEDATYIQKYLAGIITEQEIEYTAANVCQTGTVTIDDATKIQKKIAEIIDEL